MEIDEKEILKQIIGILKNAGLANNKDTQFDLLANLRYFCIDAGVSKARQQQQEFKKDGNDYAKGYTDAIDKIQKEIERILINNGVAKKYGIEED